MRLRQIALVARELNPVVVDLCHVLGIEVSINDPGVGEFGLTNAVMPMGDTFLEVVAPEKDGTTAGRYIERRKGDGGYMLLFQTDDHEADKKRMADLGIRLVWEAEYPDATGMHLHPRDTGGAIVSIDAMRPPESWRWAGKWEEKVHRDIIDTVVAVEIQTDDPASLANRWAEIFDRKEPTEEGGVYNLAFDESEVRFVQAEDDRGEGIRAFDLIVNDSGELLRRAKERSLESTDDGVKIGGAWFNFAKDSALT